MFQVECVFQNSCWEVIFVKDCWSVDKSWPQVTNSQHQANSQGLCTHFTDSLMEVGWVYSQFLGVGQLCHIHVTVEQLPISGCLSLWLAFLPTQKIWRLGFRPYALNLLDMHYVRGFNWDMNPSLRVPVAQRGSMPLRYLVSIRPCPRDDENPSLLGCALRLSLGSTASHQVIIELLHV